MIYPYPVLYIQQNKGLSRIRLFGVFSFTLFMGYRVIYIEKCEYLRLYLDNLKVEIKNDTLLIPVSDIQILVIDNYQSNLSVPLINKGLTSNLVTLL